MKTQQFGKIALVAVLALGGADVASAQSSATSFFVTSVGSGKGADFGGLAGADRHCQTLAAAAGAGGKTWRAYLSTQGPQAANAKDRIGSGPWQNAKGAVVAKDVAELHATNNLTKQTALTEKGDMLPGRGDTPNKHDILTGSQPDGMAYPGSDSANTTCGNWVRYFPMSGKARVGHFDRDGNDPVTGKSWNSSHDTMGCSQDELKSTGGDGLFYCFAAN